MKSKKTFYRQSLTSSRFQKIYVSITQRTPSYNIAAHSERQNPTNCAKFLEQHKLSDIRF